MTDLITRLLIALFSMAIVVRPFPTPAENSVADVYCSYSSLWGVAGEKWTPEGRLPDFSYAGYHAGEATIPEPRARWDLKRDFHAVGDGSTDDTQALITALETARNGVLFIPAGSYVISKRIDITKGNLILRGAGPNKTILLFPKSLTDLFGNKAQEIGRAHVCTPV